GGRLNASAVLQAEAAHLAGPSDSCAPTKELEALWRDAESKRIALEKAKAKQATPKESKAAQAPPDEASANAAQTKQATPAELKAAQAAADDASAKWAQVASEVQEADVFKWLHQQARWALCLSGGGIRSATFALGVLEGLAAKGVLDRFDYLSTVSGGGYIGS